MYLIQGDALSAKGTGRDRSRNVGMDYDLGMRDGWVDGWMEGRKEGFASSILGVWVFFMSFLIGKGKKMPSD